MKNWEPHEDEILKRALAEMGPRWRMIAKLLPGRTEAMCRNRRQRMEAANKPDATSRNRCLVCGELKKGHTCTKRAQLNVVKYQVPTNASPSLLGAARGVVQELQRSASDTSYSGSYSGASPTVGMGAPYVPSANVAPTLATGSPPLAAAPTRAPSAGFAALPAPAGMPPMVTRSSSSHIGGALPGHSFDLSHLHADPSFGDAMQLDPADVVPADAAPPMLKRRQGSMPLGSFRSFGSFGSLGSFGAQLENATGAETNTAMGILAESAAAAQPSPVDEVLARAGAKPPPRPSDSVLESLGLPTRARGASDTTEATQTTAPNTPHGSPDRAELTGEQLRTMGYAPVASIVPAGFVGAPAAAGAAAADDLSVTSREISGIDMAVLVEEAAA